MNVLLIRIGKAWDALRREGLFRGGRRILSSAFSLFRPVRPGDILFVTGGVGDSARYRAHHVAEALNLHGLKASVTTQDNPFLFSYADTFSVFVFHRVLFTEGIAKFIVALKDREKEIIFETDDLTFDPALFARTDAYVQMGALERKLYAQGLGGEILDDPYVKTATTTTSFLADRLRAHGKRVFVVPNKLSDADVETAEKALKSHHDDKGDTSVTLAYFSGSASHDRDFATISEPLLGILGGYPKVDLVIYGPLHLDKRFDAFGGRIRRVPYAPRERHWEHIADSDINLAPLVIGDPFCESKSELKFFEAGILGVPTVASATGVFREAIEDGIDGFVCATSEEWTEKLIQLIVDPDLRKRIGARARGKTLAKYVTKSVGNRDYLQYLHEKVSLTVAASSK